MGGTNFGCCEQTMPVHQYTLPLLTGLLSSFTTFGFMKMYGMANSPQQFPVATQPVYTNNTHTIERIIEKVITVDKPVFIDKIIETPVMVDKIVYVPLEKIVYQDKFIEVPCEIINPLSPTDPYDGL